MYNYKKLTLGIAPTRRDTFLLPEYAVANKKRMMERILSICNGIHDLEVFTIDDICVDGLLVELEDVDRIANYFADKKIDALFIPHANFGQEEAIAKLAKKMNLPVLLWGPRDGEPNSDMGFRKHDTQCGMFASSRALLRYGVPFTYIENCWLDSPILKRGIEDFIRVASIVKAFRNMRVLTLANRPRQFISVKVNEGELLERFGIEITPVTGSEWMAEVDRCLAEKEDEIDALVSDWEKRVNLCGTSKENSRCMAAAELAVLSLAEKYSCNTVASECWETMINTKGFRSCFVHADLTEKGLSVSCECDVNGAVSSALCQAATRGETPPFFADITVRHPSNDNAELMWHCGPYPPSLARNQQPDVLDCTCSFELKPGEITMMRFDGNRGVYNLFADIGVGVNGPKTSGSYVWLETKDWPAWEKKLMFGPYIHHIVGIYGNYKEIFKESCKYLGTEFDSVE